MVPATRIDVNVRNCVVRLSGILTDERRRQALRVTAENIPAVKKVEHHIIWIERDSGMFAAAPQEGNKSSLYSPSILTFLVAMLAGEPLPYPQWKLSKPDGD